MPRQIRIEYPGATYHCMARGDRREPIFLDEEDCRRFHKLLGELVQRTGWEVYAWVAMTNHYHLVFRTPEANLVEGMKWLQNTWTKRFNARHRLWGHVFGGRYKAVLVEENEHLSCLIDYVHLNPFRAGMVKIEDGLDTFSWSSLSDYLKPPRKRAGWVQVERGLEQKEIRGDTARNRRLYLEHLEGIARDSKGIPDLPDSETRGLQSTLFRGWVFGGEAFREKLIKRLDKLKEKMPDGECKRTSGYTGQQAQDHREAAATQLRKLGMKMAGLKTASLASLAKNDWRKRAIGRAIRRNTSVRAAWLASKLEMGNVVRTAALTAGNPDISWGPHWKDAQKLLAKIERAYQNID